MNITRKRKLRCRRSSTPRYLPSGMDHVFMIVIDWMRRHAELMRVLYLLYTAENAGGAFYNANISK